jgi:hypothetical protein
MSCDNFSEDMDFSLLQRDDTFNIEEYFSAIHEEFKAMGREIEIKRKAKSNQSQIESAFLKDNTDIINLSFQTDRIVKIKLEVDKNPPQGFKTEFKLLMFPFSFMTRCYDLPGLFAGKMHALLFRSWNNRVKGRDWFDFEWYIRNEVLLDFSHLKMRSLQSGYAHQEDFTPDVFLTLLKEKINVVNFKLAKNDVLPFLRNPQSLEIWSAEYFLLLSDKIRFREE